MRQRNDTGYTQNVSAWPTDEFPDLPGPFEVLPGSECDHPTLLAGFTAVETPEPAPASKPAKKTTAAQSASTEGGESA